MFNVFITNLGKYNEGELVGKWLELPCDDLEAELEEIGVIEGTMYEEYFITDYENSFGYAVGGYENLGDLNELAEELEDVDEEILAALIEARGYDIAEAIEKYRRGEYVYYGDREMKDIAYEIIETCYNLPEFSLRYFDYDSYIRDLLMDTFYETDHGIIEIFH